MLKHKKAWLVIEGTCASEIGGGVGSGAFFEIVDENSLTSEGKVEAAGNDEQEEAWLVVCGRGSEGECLNEIIDENSLAGECVGEEKHVVEPAAVMQGPRSLSCDWETSFLRRRLPE